MLGGQALRVGVGGGGGGRLGDGPARVHERDLPATFYLWPYVQYHNNTVDLNSVQAVVPRKYEKSKSLMSVFVRGIVGSGGLLRVSIYHCYCISTKHQLVRVFVIEGGSFPPLRFTFPVCFPLPLRPSGVAQHSTTLGHHSFFDLPIIISVFLGRFFVSVTACLLFC